MNKVGAASNYNCTYFVQVQDEGIPHSERMIKIGKTTQKDRSKRLAGLQVGCPYPLIMVGFLTYDCETALHEMFEHIHYRGEWFKPSVELTDYIWDKAIIPLNTTIYVGTGSEILNDTGRMAPLKRKLH